MHYKLSNLMIANMCHPEPLLSKFAFCFGEIKKMLYNFNSWGGVEPDGFFPLFFKNNSSTLSPRVIRLYRFLFQFNISPSEHKLCNTVPVPDPKSGISAFRNN